jgi:hypothetical protein
MKPHTPEERERAHKIEYHKRKVGMLAIHYASLYIDDTKPLLTNYGIPWQDFWYSKLTFMSTKTNILDETTEKVVTITLAAIVIEVVRDWILHLYENSYFTPFDRESLENAFNFQLRSYQATISVEILGLLKQGLMALADQKIPEAVTILKEVKRKAG